ncbi:hypothetical protein GPOL_c24330 [Gordonia polyisoprenivorans VH2]|uniref:DUF3556 domain-containing protein n=1 Tax=Gordonia polyisoprenivorans (strain DSM 44266 / VH2) TaxID=1112204 RepID=H6N2N7_GORPV|nr:MULTISPECIES: DUF3556 domain-containing protein [Gordonia]AFA73462.1 hypothetical protein GPOL_c24330 [Gordonia polyisoprenivorans VH2]MDF3284686.1 DUF3556 domain-containing protein [Gordonia sp. N1V]OPX15269.1 hypothetical protein B1964_10745 [Gordonia sp. i37]QUD85036.1 DUF3556 domain-containing protein [Gordonia polyisoprenivorans]UZF58907.1 DUF3556 domain-containing protein [Gordonia polyisoprenivorans]
MGFTTPDFPPVEPETFLDRPFLDRLRVLGAHWAEYGFGTPKMVHTIYLIKVGVLYIVAGLCIATFSSGLNVVDVGSWWNELIVYQKVVLWTVLLETLGLGGSWGPLAGHFKPMTGGFLFWLRPETIRLPPWPGRVPFTRGDSRTVADVVVYAAILITIVVALALPGVASSSMNSVVAGDHGVVNPVVLYPLIALFVVIGLRDKVIFIAARSEQYLPALVFFAFLPYVDMILALKLLIVTVWVGAGISKLGHHFSMVIPPMLSNTPWLPFRSIKRAHYRDFPHDMRPSRLASGVGHVLGTIVEIVTPLVLLFSTNKWLTLAGVVLMVCFHLFIFSTFPLAVPLEWNILFAYASIFLFWGHPTWDGFALTDTTMPWVLALIAAALCFFPVLGNLRPDLVSFLPSMRQYAGNWASATWAFAPGAEDKLDQCVVRSSKNTRTQLLASYPPEVADVVMHQMMAWRSLHSQGRALFSLMMRHLGDDIDTYTLREAEFSCNSLVAFNFGDGHLHDEKMIAALQRRCDFAPGEFTIAWIESQPIHKGTQRYKVIDAALGVIETGTYRVADAVAEQPWLPNGPIPVQVDWTLDIDARRALTDPEIVTEPRMRSTPSRQVQP